MRLKSDLKPLPLPSEPSVSLSLMPPNPPTIQLAVVQVQTLACSYLLDHSPGLLPGIYFNAADHLALFWRLGGHAMPPSTDLGRGDGVCDSLMVVGPVGGRAALRQANSGNPSWSHWFQVSRVLVRVNFRF